PDFAAGAAPSALAVACDGPAKHTNSPVASINAERPLALIIMWQSPHLPVPGAKETSRRVHSGAEKGNLRASPGENGAAKLRGVSALRRFGHETAGIDADV